MRPKDTPEAKAEKLRLKNLGSDKNGAGKKNPVNNPAPPSNIPATPPEPPTPTVVPNPEPPAPVNPVPTPEPNDSHTPSPKDPPPAPSQPQNNQFRSFAGPVDQRAYQVPPVNTGLTSQIPEQEFVIQQPKLENLNNPQQPTPTPTTGANSNTPPPSPQSPPATPMAGFSSLNEGEKRQGAEMLTDMVISGYKALHKVGQAIVEVDDDDLLALHVDGKVDMMMKIPLSEDEQSVISLQDFFKSYNEQTKKALTVSDQFVAAVREPMIRICIKNGWYMKDEYFVLYKFGEDLGIKVMMIANFKKTINKTLKTFMFVHNRNKEEKAAETALKNPPPPQQDPVPVPAKEETPAP